MRCCFKTIFAKLNDADVLRKTLKEKLFLVTKTKQWFGVAENTIDQPLANLIRGMNFEQSLQC